MKTSNKLLIFAFATLLTIIMAVLIWLKLNYKEIAITSSGKEVSKSMELSEFNSLSVSGNFEVMLIADSSFTANFKTDENFLEYIQFEQVDKTLKIKMKSGVGLKNKIKLDLGISNLSSIKISSGASVLANQRLIEESLDLNISSESFSKLEIEVQNLISNISSGSELLLSGKAENATFDLSSGSELEAFDLDTDTASIKVSSGSDSKIKVNKSLNATASSGASIYYKGEASVVSSNISSGGELKKY